MSQPQIAAIERGKGDPKLGTLARLARALGYRLDQLIADAMRSSQLHRQTGRSLPGAARTVKQASEALDFALALREHYRPEYERSFKQASPPESVRKVERTIREAVADLVRLNPTAICADPRVRQFLERAVQLQSPEDRQALGAALAASRAWDRRLERAFPAAERVFRERHRQYMRTGKWPRWSNDQTRRSIRRFQRVGMLPTDKTVERWRRETLEARSTPESEPAD